MMAVVPAVSVCPTCAVPVIVGAPVAGVLVTVELLVTAGTLSMPVVKVGGVVAGGVGLDGVGVVAGGGVGVGDDDGLALEDGSRKLIEPDQRVLAGPEKLPGTRTLETVVGTAVPQ